MQNKSNKQCQLKDLGKRMRYCLFMLLPELAIALCDKFSAPPSITCEMRSKEHSQPANTNNLEMSQTG